MPDNTAMPFLTSDKILIAVPNEGWIRKELSTLLRFWDKYPNVEIYTPEIRPIHASRNHCVKRFLEFTESDDDRLWFIDSDIVPPPNALAKLVMNDKDIVGGSCLVPKLFNGRHCVYKTSYCYNDDNELKVANMDGLAKVDVTGTGCLMIKRSVLKGIEKPFEFVLDERGELVTSEDFDFCRKVTEAGIDIWYDNDVPCDHIRTVSLGKVYHG
jgi:GT2 family glycosyltransferase